LKNTTGLRSNRFANILRQLLWPSLLVLAMFLWATVYPITKIIAGQLNPISVSFFRYCFGTLPLLPLFLTALRRGPSRPGGRDCLALAALGLLGVGCFSALLVYGIWASTASNGAVLANTQPIFVVLLSPLLIDERFSLRSNITPNSPCGHVCPRLPCCARHDRRHASRQVPMPLFRSTALKSDDNGRPGVPLSLSPRKRRGGGTPCWPWQSRPVIISGWGEATHRSPRRHSVQPCRVRGFRCRPSIFIRFGSDRD